ncbi:MAG: hypothetical protein M5U26_10815 [Planctomycetota bacterium]|nr:hypothetical protein [Planctomycetota bacterium]
MAPVAAQAENPAGPYRLFGWLTPPAAARPNRSQLYLAVNGRPVRDRTFQAAVSAAYRHLLPARRFPAGVLYLELPGEAVDINVHPAKAEVRFRQPDRVFSLLYQAVRETFAPQAPSLVNETRPAAEAARPDSVPVPPPRAPERYAPARNSMPPRRRRTAPLDGRRKRRGPGA